MIPIAAPHSGPPFFPIPMRPRSPFYPLSLPGILLLGFVLVALPPVLALLDAYFSLNRISVRSESAIVRATEITRDSRALSEHLTALERLARQQLVLGGAAGIAAYDLRRESFVASIERLSKHMQTLDIGKQLLRLRTREADVRQILGHPDPKRPQASEIAQGFVELDALAADVVHEADARIERDIDSLREEAALALAQLLRMLWILVPSVLLLSIVLTVLIRQPFRQIERAMRGLGEGRFDHPVRISGPGDMVRLGERLDWLRTRLQALDAQRTRLLHHISHELKTPLTALQEGTALLQDKLIGPLTPGQQEVLAILAANCQRLRRLIENLLDYSGLRSSPVHMQLETLRPLELLAEVAADHKLAASARVIHFEIESDDQPLRADRDKLRVIVDNLVSNAIKYAPTGSCICLRARAERRRMLIEVADTGPGIPPELAPGLFEAFVQGPPPEGSAVKGSGLGLSIVRELVALHGGSVELLPNQPCGTLARVSLPTSG